MIRRSLAVVLLAVLATTSGCAALGPSPVDADRLTADADYDWTTDANVTITVGPDRYQAVYRISNRSRLTLYQYQRFNNKRPFDPEAARFRYPNGTVVTIGPGAVEKTRSGTTITLPAERGQLGLRAPKTGKRIRAPTVVEGSYEVVLPEGAWVRFPFLGRVIPRGYDRTVEDGRVHIRWGEIERDRIVVQYYLVRDLLILGGLLVIAGVLLVGGLLYFWLQLRSLRERREQVAIEGDSGEP
ncbi:MAG: DUF5803 family protein [Halobacteriales archaeon]